MILEFVKFIIYSLLIVLVSKYFLVTLLRKLAEVIELDVDVTGKITGVATSVPEFLTVSFSAFNGLIDTGLFNIIGSNVINFIQYTASIVFNKNRKLLKNKLVRIDLVLVLFTIVIPVFLYLIRFEANITVVPVYILLGTLFFIINRNAYKLYSNEDKKIDKNNKEVKEKAKVKKGKKFLIFRYSLGLIFVGVLLYVIGNSLSDSLEELCFRFNISEIILGLLLGFITSLPELITFLESQKHHKKNDNEELGVIEATNNLLASNFLNLFVIQTIGILIFTIVFR